MPKPIYLGMDFEVENPKDVLYKNSIKQEIKQLEKEELLNELGDCLSASQILYSTNEDLKRIRYFLYKNKTQDETIEYILKLIKKHSKNVGETQAIKDLQRGLSILNKNRRDSIIEAKNILKEDGIFGKKTKATLYDVCKNYSLNIIKKYILRGIINNIIFDTKNNPNINTKKKIEGVLKDLRRY